MSLPCSPSFDDESVVGATRYMIVLKLVIIMHVLHNKCPASCGTHIVRYFHQGTFFSPQRVRFFLILFPLYPLWVQNHEKRAIQTIYDGISAIKSNICCSAQGTQGVRPDVLDHLATTSQPNTTAPGDIRLCFHAHKTPPPTTDTHQQLHVHIAGRPQHDHEATKAAVHCRSSSQR